MDMKKTDRFKLALSEDGETRPDWVPDVQWHGKMSGPIIDFCTSMMAAGHTDVEIHQACKEWFNGPLTKKPIVLLRETHAHVIAEKIEQISREMARIPIAHKAYRLQVLNRAALKLMGKFHEEVDASTPGDAEKLTRAVAKVIGMAREEMEGSQATLNQQNIYIDAVNNIDLDKIDDLASILGKTYDEIQKVLGGTTHEETIPAIDAEFQVDEDD
jgi:hypothetical protein